MNEFPQVNHDDTSGGENVFFMEFVTTMMPATLESKLRPRYGVPDNRWRMEKPSEGEQSSKDEGTSEAQPE